MHFNLRFAIKTFKNRLLSMHRLPFLPFSQSILLRGRQFSLCFFPGQSSLSSQRIQNNVTSTQTKKGENTLTNILRTQSCCTSLSFFQHPQKRRPAFFDVTNIFMSNGLKQSIFAINFKGCCVKQTGRNARYWVRVNYSNNSRCLLDEKFLSC